MVGGESPLGYIQDKWGKWLTTAVVGGESPLGYIFLQLRVSKNNAVVGGESPLGYIASVLPDEFRNAVVGGESPLGYIHLHFIHSSSFAVVGGESPLGYIAGLLTLGEISAVVGGESPLGYIGCPLNLAAGWSCDERRTLKQEHLVGGLLGRHPFFSVKYLHFSELSVCDRHEADLAGVGQYLAEMVSVDVAGFFASAVAGVDRVLQHRKTASEQGFAKLGVRFARRLGFDRQIKHGNQPHGTVL